MKYLMQQPTSCTLKCFPDILAFDKTEKFLPVITNDEEKKSPTDWKPHSVLSHHVCDISTDCQAMPHGALPISPERLICLEKNKIIIGDNNGTSGPLQIKIRESLPAE